MPMALVLSVYLNLVSQESQPREIEVTSPAKGSPSHGIEAQTPVGRFGLGMDGSVDTAGAKDVQVGYVYSIAVSDRLRSTLDLMPFFVQRVDVNENGIRPDPTQGAGLLMRYQPESGSDLPSWFVRLKALNEADATNANKDSLIDQWEVLFMVEVPLDSQVDERRRSDGLDRVRPKPSIELSVPMTLFENPLLNPQDRIALHNLILINYLIRVSEALGETDPHQFKLHSKFKMLDMQNFPDPLKLITLIENRLRDLIRHFDRPEDRRLSLKGRLARLLFQYQLFISAMTPTEIRTLGITPGSFRNQIYETYLNSDQILNDFVETFQKSSITN